MNSLEYRLVETRRLRTAIRRHGDDDGLPMLLLHGGLATGRWWERLMEVLPAEICAVAPDLRGCGGTERPDYGYTVTEMAADVAALLEQLDWREIDLVGHAYGAAVAIEVALAYPTLVRTLTLIAPPPIEGVFTPIDTLMLLDQMRTDEVLLAHALAAVMPTLSADTPQEAELTAHLVEDASGLAPHAYSGMAAALAQWNRASDARRLTLPTLLMWGDQDIIVDRGVVTRTLVAIPGANNLEILRGVGHCPMIEAPLLVAERLIEFITEDFDDYDQARAEAFVSSSDAE